MFAASADKTAQLTDWVCLGTLYAGGEVDLHVTLAVPAELDNAYQSQIGYLDWEFRVEEFPVEDTDPQPPHTGDNAPVGIWILGLVLSATMIGILLYLRKKQKEEKQ